MQEHLTTDSGSLSSPIPEDSMFRTPQAKEGEGGAIFEDVKRDRGNHVMVRDQVAQLALQNGFPVSEGLTDALLPTPNTMEHREIKTPEQIAELKAKSPGGYRNLRESVVNELLPTPIVRDYKDGSAAQERDGKVSTDTVARAIFNSGEVLLGTPRTSSANSPSSKQVENGADKARLEDQVRSANEGYISWGKFEPAIRRWEQVLGRPAPAPTKPDGKDGNHRLAAEFTEWMMGLDFGHVTNPELGLTRVEMLKLCGNGVVPQQAELALRMLLDGHVPEFNANPVMPTLTTNGTGRHSAGYDSLGTLQMIEVAKGILPREYDSWDQINGKIPEEWRDGKAKK